MSGAIVSQPKRRQAGKALAVLLAILGIPLAVALAVALVFVGGGTVASPADVTGPPVRAMTPAGDRVYMLTTQWKTFRGFGRGPNRPTYTDLLVDVWAFDAITGKPVWRHRLERGRDERSSRPAGPSATKRATHLFTVLISTPKAVARAFGERASISTRRTISARLTGVVRAFL